MSALGLKPTSENQTDVCFWHEADIEELTAYVCFRGKAGFSEHAA
jgi:hypothetical protein